MTEPAIDRVRFRRARVEEILPLRHAALIVGTDRHTDRFDGDEAPETIHVGGFLDDRCVACASIMRRDLDGRPGRQLRGMATAADLRGRGIGAALLRFAEQQVGPDELWCNAREHAVGFYAGHGWRAAGAVFEIPGVGPHVRMVRAG